MSIYLEFPAIEDYPVYIPLEHITAVIPDWLANLVQTSAPETDDADN
jgi:hypothetical protein